MDGKATQIILILVVGLIALSLIMPSSASSNISITSIVGVRPSSESLTITELQLTIKVSTGEVDLSQLAIQIHDGYELAELSYSSSASSRTTFNVTELRDDDNSITSATPVMNAGDLVTININTGAAGLTLEPGTKASISLIQKTGATHVIEFTTPATYGVKIYI